MPDSCSEAIMHGNMMDGLAAMTCFTCVGGIHTQSTQATGWRVCNKDESMKIWSQRIELLGRSRIVLMCNCVFCETWTQTNAMLYRPLFGNRNMMLVIDGFRLHGTLLPNSSKKWKLYKHSATARPLARGMCATELHQDRPPALSWSLFPPLIDGRLKEASV